MTKTLRLATYSKSDRTIFEISRGSWLRAPLAVIMARAYGAGLRESSSHKVALGKERDALVCTCR